MPTPWKDEYRSGFETIDAQHQALFRALDAIERAFGGPNPEVEVQRHLQLLVLYCDVHFREEEQLFRQAGIPGLEAQVLEHKNILRDVHEQCDRWHRGERGVTKELLSFAQRWVVEHVVRWDLPMLQLVRGRMGRGVREPAEPSRD